MPWRAKQLGSTRGVSRCQVGWSEKAAEERGGSESAFRRGNDGQKHLPQDWAWHLKETATRPACLELSGPGGSW